MGIFDTQKMLMCTLFGGRGRGLRKCMVCTLMTMLTIMDGPLLYIHLQECMKLADIDQSGEISLEEFKKAFKDL